MTVRILVRLRKLRTSTLNVPKKEHKAGPVMSLDAAKREAESLLGDPQRFEVSTPSATGGDLDQLGPLTREFFTRYPHVESSVGGMAVGRDLIQPSTYIHGYLSIGHSEDWDIVQTPGNDTVFVVEGSETTPEVEYETIYQFIVHEVSLDQQT